MWRVQRKATMRTLIKKRTVLKRLAPFIKSLFMKPFNVADNLLEVVKNLLNLDIF